MPAGIPGATADHVFYPYAIARWLDDDTDRRLLIGKLLVAAFSIRFQGSAAAKRCSGPSAPPGATNREVEISVRPRSRQTSPNTGLRAALHGPGAALSPPGPVLQRPSRERSSRSRTISFQPARCFPRSSPATAAHRPVRAAAQRPTAMQAVMGVRSSCDAFATKSDFT